MSRRLHAVCPRCNPALSLALRTQPMRPDGRVVQHSTYSAGRGSRCAGSGALPEPEAVSAWLAGHEGEAIEAVRRAREAHTRAEVALAAAEREREECAAWCAEQRARLAKGRE